MVIAKLVWSWLHVSLLLTEFKEDNKQHPEPSCACSPVLAAEWRTPVVTVYKRHTTSQEKSYSLLAAKDKNKSLIEAIVCIGVEILLHVENTKT